MSRPAFPALPCVFFDTRTGPCIGPVMQDVYGPAVPIAVCEGHLRLLGRAHSPHPDHVPLGAPDGP